MNIKKHTTIAWNVLCNCRVFFIGVMYLYYCTR